MYLLSVLQPQKVPQGWDTKLEKLYIINRFGFIMLRK